MRKETAVMATRRWSWRGVMKGDPAAAKPGTLSVGDVLLVRGHLFKVCAVTGGGMPCKIYGGSDLIVFDRKFNFNARKVVARRCLPVTIRAKQSLGTDVGK